MSGIRTKWKLKGIWKARPQCLAYYEVVLCFFIDFNGEGLELDIPTNGVQFTPGRSIVWLNDDMDGFWANLVKNYLGNNSKGTRPIQLHYRLV